MSPRRQGSQVPSSPPKKPDAYALTNFPFGDAGAEGFDAADYFVAGDAREFQAGIGAGDRGGVGVADAAGFYPDANLAGCGLGDGAFYYFEDIWRGGLLPLCRCFSFGTLLSRAWPLCLAWLLSCFE